jgi:hypothetical protein
VTTFLSFSGLFIYQQPIFNAIRWLGYFGGFRWKVADTLNYNIVVQTTDNKRKKKHNRLRNLNVRKQRSTVKSQTQTQKRTMPTLKHFSCFPFLSQET